jgi:hypothetical protein
MVLVILNLLVLYLKTVVLKIPEMMIPVIGLIMVLTLKDNQIQLNVVYSLEKKSILI